MGTVKLLLSVSAFMLLTACSSGGDGSSGGSDASAGDNVDSNKTKVVNKAPIANAGADLNGQVGQQLTITGAGTDSDGTISSYEWKKGSTVVSSTASFDYTPSSVGTEIFTLTVTDNKGATGSDTMSLVSIAATAVNNAPFVEAGADVSVKSGSSVTLNGVGTDSDGTVTTVEWLKNGQVIATTLSFVYNATAVGTDTLTLKVTDDDGASSSDTVAVTVLPNALPTANAGSNLAVQLNNKITITGSGSDTDGTITSYAWADAQGTVLSTTSSLDYNGTVLGLQTLTFSVTDNDGATATDTMDVNVTSGVVANNAPFSDAGGDISVKEGTEVTLTGTASDSDGSVASVSWIKDGSSVATANTYTYTPSIVGTDTFTFEVTDDDGDTSSDSVDVTVVANIVPIVNAGDDLSTLHNEKISIKYFKNK